MLSNFNLYNCSGVRPFRCGYANDSHSSTCILIFVSIALSRNLLYTGLTRAKKLAIIGGSQKAIDMAVRSVNQKERYTQLQQTNTFLCLVIERTIQATHI